MHANRIEALEPRRLLAVITWDGGGDGTSWHDPLNWSADALPTALDDVEIDVPGEPTIRVTSGIHAIASLSSSEALEIAGGTLEVAGPSVIDAPFRHLSGWFRGTGNLVLNGPATIHGGAFYEGDGDISLAAPSTLHTSSGQVIYLGGTRRLLLGADTIALAANSASTTSLRLAGAAAMEVAPGVTLTLHNGFDIRSSGATLGTLLNNGALVKTGPGESLVEAVYQGPGSLAVNEGTLLLADGATSTTVEVAGGATLATRKFDFEVGSLITGAGTVHFRTAPGSLSFESIVNVRGTYDIAGGTILEGYIARFLPEATILSLGDHLTFRGGFNEFQTDQHLVIPRLISIGGWLLGSDDMTVTGPADLGAYLRIGGTGTLRLEGLATFDSGSFGSIEILETRRLVIAGEAIVRGSGFNGSGVRIATNAVLEVLPGASLTMEGNALIGTAETGGTDGLVMNHGSISKTGGGSSVIGVNFGGHGPVTVEDGAFSVGPSVGALDTDFHVGAQGALRISHATLSAASSVTGAGHVTLYGHSGWPLNVNGLYDIGGGTVISGSDVNFNPEATLLSLGASLDISGIVNFSSGESLTVDTFTQVGGILGGSDTILVKSSTFVDAATDLEGTGVLILEGSAIFDVNSYAAIDVRGSRQIIVRGQLTALSTHPYPTNGPLRLSESASLEIEPGGTLLLQGRIHLARGGAPQGIPKLVNRGMLLKSGGESIVEVDYLGDGNVAVEAGLLGLTGGSTASAISVHAGATLSLGGMARELFLAAGSIIAGTGAVNFSAGSVIVAGTYDVAGPTAFTGAAASFVAGAAVVSLDGLLDIRAGSVDFSTGVPLAIDSYRHTGGMLKGSDDVQVTGQGLLNGGATVGGTGKLVLPGPTTFNMTVGRVVLADARSVVLTGDATLIGRAPGSPTSHGRLEIGPGAALALVGGVRLSDGGAVPPVLANAGELLALGAGEVRVEADVTGAGDVRVRDGARLVLTAPAGPFKAEGLIDIGAGCELRVLGDIALAGTAGPVARIELAEDGHVLLSASGTINLDPPLSSSRFAPVLAPGFDPPAGERFDVIVADGGIVNGFDLISGVMTPGGLPLLATRPEAGTLAVMIASAAPAPAQVTSSRFEFETGQTVVFSFSGDVGASLSRHDLVLLNLTTGQVIAPSVGTLEYDPAGLEGAFRLGGALPDGNYLATLPAGSFANAAGLPTTQDFTLELYVLAGDANRDRRVNLADLAILRANFGQDGRTFSQGDFNYDGTVNLADLAILRGRFGIHLPPPPGRSLFGDGGAGGGAGEDDDAPGG